MINKYTRSFLSIAALTLMLGACAEKEDMVMPRETCDTVATVRYQQSAGVQLVLENGQVLQPENVKSSAGQKQLEIDGFTVKPGQQIIIGYTPSGQSARSVKVNCIVGVQ